MALAKRIALTPTAVTGTCNELIELAKQAEAVGYDDLWFADTGYPDVLTMAALIAKHTNKVRLGIAVVPAYTRTPAVLANAAATINELAGGRFILGLGSSSQTMMEGWHGVDFERPLTRVRETTELLRSMIAGEKSNFAGKTLRSHGYRQKPAEHPQKIYLAGLRPKMVEMAAAVGDGVILNLFPQEALPRIMQHIAVGAEKAGKDPADVDVVCRYQVAVTEDLDAHREMFRRSFVPYFATPVYNEYLKWAGYPEVAQVIREGWAAKDRDKTRAAIGDELVDAIGIIGSKEYCQQRIRDDAALGINVPIITLASPDAATRQATLEAFSKEEFSF
ncbi:MAG: LLM class flavin-dependent oxidoreductase [Pseudomonadales bacterium]